MKTRYGVIVIGSGYGGAITAARLAQAGHDVCILERGKEWQSGQFPEDKKGVLKEMKSCENPLGLYEYIRGDDVDIFCGNGLGGTSLINANVAIQPSPELFARPEWPRAIREESLPRYFHRAAAMLQIAEAQTPDGGELAKVAAHERSGQARPGSFRRLDLAVNFDRFADQPNHVGVVQSPCTLCGNCITGCNHRAKNDLTMNYLPLAREHGAEIYPQVEVDFVQPEATGGYHVFARHRPLPGAEPVAITVHARVVVLAAGVMGTLGILLRSRARGMALPHKLGHAFSSNGDLLGIGYNNDIRTNSVGMGRSDSRDYAVGCTIMSMMDYRDGNALDQQFIIEEGAIPQALVAALRYSLPKASFFDGEDTDSGFRDKAVELARIMRDLVQEDPRGALNHSMIYLGMGHDGADGRIILGHDGNARLLWGTVPDRPVFLRLDEEMRALVTELGGTHVSNPRGTRLLGNNEVTVHPLGGCPMGDDRDGGVVDHAGRVFDPRAPQRDAVYQGLLIVDGSIIPTSVGVNPFLTISALAERIAEHFNAAHPDPVLPDRRSITTPCIPELRPGLEFTEDMRGHCTRSVSDASSPSAFARAEALAKQESEGKFDVRLTILTDDVEAFLSNPDHEARAEGHIDAPMFGGRLRVEQGSFNLFAEESVKKMKYRLAFIGDDDQRYLIQGEKIIRDDPSFDIWVDSTTLYTSVRSGWSLDAPIVAQGVLHVHIKDFLEQLTTFRVRHVDDPSVAAHWLARFGAFFFGELWETYVKPRWGTAFARVA